MKSKFLVPLVLLMAVLSSPSSSAIDIPLLTWEQGKSQSVVLGGPNASNNWQVNLVSESGIRIPFRASALNESKFRVYTIDLSNQISLGRYSVETQGPGSPLTLVSEVLIVPAESYEVPRAPYDLLFIMGFLAIFVSAVISIRKSRTIVSSFPNHIADLQNFVTGQNFSSIAQFNRNSLEVKRVKFVTGLPDSFLKTLLLADTNFVYTLPARGFLGLPVLSFALGGSLFLAHETVAPFSALSAAILALLIFISHLDLLSGIIGSITYLSFHILLSGNLDVRSGLSALLLTGVFIFPALFNLTGKLTSSELQKSTKATYFILSFFGILYIPSSFLVVKSLNSNQTFSSSSIPYLMAIALISLLMKQKLISRFLETGIEKNADLYPETLIVRLFSNGSIVALFVILTVLFMNWTENLGLSFLAAFTWTVPFLLSSIRLEGAVVRFSSRAPRKIWLEIALVLALVIGIFMAARTLPYLVQDLSAVLLILLAIPSVIHALFVLIASSSTSGEVSA